MEYEYKKTYKFKTCSISRVRATTLSFKKLLELIGADDKSHNTLSLKVIKLLEKNKIKVEKNAKNEYSVKILKIDNHDLEMKRNFLLDLKNFDIFPKFIDDVFICENLEPRDLFFIDMFTTVITNFKNINDEIIIHNNRESIINFFKYNSLSTVNYTDGVLNSTSSKSKTKIFGRIKNFFDSNFNNNIKVIKKDGKIVINFNNNFVKTEEEFNKYKEIILLAKNKIKTDINTILTDVCLSGVSIEDECVFQSIRKIIFGIFSMSYQQTEKLECSDMVKDVAIKEFIPYPYVSNPNAGIKSVKTRELDNVLYKVFLDGELYYIGKTTQIGIRIRHHLSTPDGCLYGIDRSRQMEIQISVDELSDVDLELYETYYIHKYKPPMNKAKAGYVGECRLDFPELGFKAVYSNWKAVEIDEID